VVEVTTVMLNEPDFFCQIKDWVLLPKVGLLALLGIIIFIVHANVTAADVPTFRRHDRQWIVSAISI